MLLPRVIRDFEFCKRSESWSEKTITWYSHTLRLFLRWLGTKPQRALCRYIETFRPDPENEDDHVFLTEGGQPLSYEGLKSWLHRLSKTVGIRIHAHLLRHTYATNYLLNDCGDVFTLQENLGHTSLEMSRRYAHLARRHQGAAKRRPGPMDSMNISKRRKSNKGKH